MDRILRFATTLMVAGSLIMASFSVGSGTAHATGPSYQGGNCPGGMTCTHWCPGDPPIPGSQVIRWDWNICHDWYWTSEGVIDIDANTIYPWHGSPHEAPPPPPYTPPPPQPLPPDCPPWSPILAPSRCGGL
ncbi:hypothetical protein BMW24_007335 [Mycobacterium heckeshornense]|uniref:Uncharacterized protein n=1 Tax=Mycobacterium heckeshornense TaxID=110505 RepID=A0A2G8BCX3_9MYCO|nr:hypothetical protein BMW24_007335 [Mycobacterium heckeshornense]BCO35733.1 hypothetical protein MHEC_21660 [Mycobacterium heckeshornense]